MRNGTVFVKSLELEGGENYIYFEAEVDGYHRPVPLDDFSDKSSLYHEVRDWLTANVGPNDWMIDTDYIEFRHPRDALAFKMYWHNLKVLVYGV